MAINTFDILAPAARTLFCIAPRYDGCSRREYDTGSVRPCFSFATSRPSGKTAKVVCEHTRERYTLKLHHPKSWHHFCEFWLSVFLCFFSLWVVILFLESQTRRRRSSNTRSYFVQWKTGKIFFSFSKSQEKENFSSRVQISCEYNGIVSSGF